MFISRDDAIYAKAGYKTLSIYFAVLIFFCNNHV
jgi:hypothetical protein